jgi:hypothetical protein
MTAEKIRDEAKGLFEKSITDEEEKTDKAKDENEAQNVLSYYSGWRDALLELFPDLDVDDPKDFPLP